MPEKRPAHIVSGETIGTSCQHDDCDPFEVLEEVHLCGDRYLCFEHCTEPECVEKRGADAS